MCMYKYRYIVSRAYRSLYALDCIHMADATLLYGKSVCCDYTYIYIIIQGFMTLIFSYQHQMLVLLNLMSSRRKGCQANMLYVYYNTVVSTVHYITGVVISTLERYIVDPPITDPPEADTSLL